TMPPSEMMIGGLAAPSACAAVRTRMFLFAVPSGAVSLRTVASAVMSMPRGGRRAWAAGCVSSWLAGKGAGSAGCGLAPASALRRAVGAVEHLHHRARRAAFNVVPDRLPVAAAGDDAFAPQQRQMLRDGRIADAEELGK